MYGSPARMRVEQETIRRSNAPVVITTVLSLLVVAAAVAAVAWLVLRTPSDAVDSPERLEPIGTALPAPTEQPTLPTPIPTEASEPVAPGFSGEAPEISGLPTVAAPQEAEPTPQAAGPTPTPRLVALPTAAPAATLLPAQPTPLPAATLPPAVPMEAVPVVALEPVEVAQPAPTAAAERPDDAADREQSTEPEEVDDDPFNIFGDGDGDGSRIVPAQNDAMERVRAIQDDADDDGEERDAFEPIGVPEIVPAESVTTDRRDGSVEIVMPDVDAMIDEITAQVTDPNRNPNVGDAGRQDDDQDGDDDRESNGRERNRGDRDRDEGDRNRDDDDRESSNAENRSQSIRERINDRFGRGTNGGSRGDNDNPGNERDAQRNNEDPSDDCFPFC